MQRRLLTGLIATSMLVAVGLSACGGGGSSQAFTNGNATSGQQLFTSYCSSCHTTGQDVLIGPGLAGLFQPGGPALPPGVDYGGNLPNGQPINEANVGAWIKSGGQGRIGVMSPQQLTDQQIADVIAYLKTLQK